MQRISKRNFYFANKGTPPLYKLKTEWEQAEGRINAEYFAWRENFARTYAERDAAWREGYVAFLEDKDEWMMEVLGSVVPVVKYLDDLLFAGLDLTQGYRTPEEVGKGLAVTAVTSAISKGGNLIKLDGIVANVVKGAAFLSAFASSRESTSRKIF